MCLRGQGKEYFPGSPEGMQCWRSPFQIIGIFSWVTSNQLFSIYHILMHRTAGLAFYIKRIPHGNMYCRRAEKILVSGSEVILSPCRTSQSQLPFSYGRKEHGHWLWEKRAERNSSAATVATQVCWQQPDATAAPHVLQLPQASGCTVMSVQERIDYSS